MDRPTITKRIETIKSEITQLQNTVCAMNTTDIHRYPENYEALSKEAAIRGENITCRLRHLIYATTNISKPDLMESAAKAHGIEFEYKDGIFKATLPALLPKRKHQKSTEFLIDPLYFALDRYTNENYIEKFRECVVCFTHIYSSELPGRRMRDYDNIELKQILDVISAYIMVDDGSFFCDAYHTTTLGKKDSTCVCVVKKDRFPAWISDMKKS